jgi:hypothetical protein
LDQNKHHSFVIFTAGNRFIVLTTHLGESS